MRTPDSRFYCPQIGVGTFTLDENESSHAVRVCRATAGDTLELCDGLGHFADATIVKADPKACEVRIDKFDTVSTERPKLNLAIACLKDDALEEVVFHAAQTEIDTIYFLRTDFSQEPKNSDLHKLVRRAELKSLVSLKQSKKPWLTRIEGPIEFDRWLDTYEGDLVLCDINGEKSVPVLEQGTTLLVGPEGGFSDKEISRIKSYQRGKTTLINLGNTRLRARTAAIIALGKFV
ncbi:MAG: 16S rRNA (uracil(1498)-N(3))-methyltransferase [Fibrobacter sp.]|uniref:RsmE family RNA methyltransferase n=1 Tax=Fibrobacter sp. TaxID=35828 RepID=UPI0025C0FAB5|nr:RsmE family RNA methyltransferase [Fibrobacter sp.]MBQ9225036.1 16S rRNA (uracil(1498)-N(3))-methyltransferase [Fibrobacter sp.]MBR2057320.1 16S rRNA (uracil(1498)-N(3))-methyltransferase [Fibrobacter sp.]MBR2306466.1 16S rRNA (uracil(1498)-N(3))-methyltransferase [Fibrobacter sp.]MBR4007553.1 16S rRNA (uracil(1498)-N(3))-methyltransferase [Fibrobacter sp.]